MTRARLAAWGLLSLLAGSGPALALSAITAPAPAQGAGYSLFCAMQPQAPITSTISQICAQYDNGSVAQRLLLARVLANGTPFAQMSSGQFITSAGVLAQGALGKIASTVSGLTLSETFNGAVPGSNASASVPTSFSRLVVGSSGSSAATEGAVTRVALWPNTALTAAQLQAVTK